MQRKRGRKGNAWKNDEFKRAYIDAATTPEERLKRQNNVSGGKYRQNKVEKLQSLVKECDVLAIEKKNLKKIYKRNKRQLKKFILSFKPELLPIYFGKSKKFA